MKIILGEYSGRHFFMPYGIRPTQSQLRKTVFDIIGHDLTGISFLELFSGSGAIGLEALSCGASEVTFVDHNPKCVGVIEDNLAIFKPVERGLKAEVVRMDSYAAIKSFARAGRSFDVVFFDPPYNLKLAKKALKTLLVHDILRPNSFVVAQYGLEERLPDPEGKLTLLRHKEYGASQLSIYQKA